MFFTLAFELLAFLIVLGLFALGLWIPFRAFLLLADAYTWLVMKLDKRLHGPSHPREY